MAEISSVIQHASLTGDNIHVAYAGTYADETARLAAKLDTSMEGKLYRQFSDNTLWMLVSAAKKTWISLGKDTAKYLGNGGNDKDPMTFYWEAQEGQPTGVWGGNDGKNMYVYNPANFNVNSANTANSANYANSAGAVSSLGGARGTGRCEYIKGGAAYLYAPTGGQWVVLYAQSMSTGMGGSFFLSAGKIYAGGALVQKTNYGDTGPSTFGDFYRIG